MALTTVDQGLLGTYAQYTGFKNRIINGAMVIDQRNAGASVTATDGGYQIDRYQTFTESADGVFTVQRVADAPAGFINSAKITVTTADASIGASQRYLFLQNIEGFNVADLGFGAAGASAVAVSFWVKASVTGTFGGTLSNTSFNRTYPFSYTISSANTWEYKTVTIAGDTSGTWPKDNGVGLRVMFGIGVGSGNSGPANAWAGAGYYQPTGSVNLISTLNATLQITGVQLEAGSTATSFDRRPYGTELMLCQRYAFQLNNQTGSNQSSRYGFGVANAATQMQSFVIHPVTMRTIPSVTVTNIGSFVVSDTTAGIVPTSISQQTNVSSPQASCLSVVVSSGLTTYRPYFLEGGAAPNGQLLFSAEL